MEQFNSRVADLNHSIDVKYPSFIRRLLVLMHGNQKRKIWLNPKKRGVKNDVPYLRD